MVKGFKKKNGKGGHDFIPTEKKTVRSSEPATEVNIEIDNNSEEFSEGVRKEYEGRIKEIPIYKLDEADDSLKEKIIEKFRNSKYESGDNYFAQGDWLLDSDIFEWSDSSGGMYYDLEGGREYLQIPSLKIKDDDKFRKLLGIDKSLWDDVYFTFKNERNGWRGEQNTTIEFEKQDNGDFTEKQQEKLDNAKEKFDDYISDAMFSLKTANEDQFTDESIIEDIRANDYDFDEDGNIA